MTNQGANNSLVQCEGFFYDEGGLGEPYKDDGGAKTDILTFCPSSSSQQAIRVTFNAFDVAPGDRLRAFDGSDTLASQFTAYNGGDGFGPSVADSPGGSMVTASCDNVGGCITFVFERNGDTVKGAGWEASVECVGRTLTKLDCSRVDQFNGPTGTHLVVGDCEDGRAFVRVPIPSFTDCGRLGRLNVNSTCSADFPSDVVAIGTGFIETYFPIGEHTLTFSSPIYGDIKCEANIRVIAPGMGCNDDLNISLSNDCVVVLTPELMLEGDCEPGTIIRPIDGAEVASFFYEVEVGPNQNMPVLGTTINGYPIVDFSTADCGMQYDVKITRKYIADTDCDGILFDGYDLDDEPLKDICWGQIRVEDKVDPVIVESPAPIAVPCYEKNYDASALLQQLNNLDPSNIGSGGAVNLLLSNTQITVEGAAALNILENCKSTITASDWEFVAGDCEEDEVPLKDIYGVESSKTVFGFYRRVFSVKDRCSNEALASQIIYVYQPDIIAPAAEYAVPCGTDIDPEALRDAWLAWVRDGRPADDARQFYASYLPNFDPTFNETTLYNITDKSGDEVPLDALKTTCGYAVDWVDSDTIQICGGGYKLFRTWTIYDWCSGVLTLTNIVPQVIQVGDKVAPEILGNTTFKALGNATLDCSLDVEFARPNVVDDCAGQVEIEVQIGTQRKPFRGNTVVLEDIPIGQLVNIKWLATDECGNTSVVTDTATFQDIISPTVSCERFRTVSLGVSCTTSIPATAFDDGSFDNCGTVAFSVARKLNGGEFPADSLFADRIEFSADDLNGNCENEIIVLFRAVDGAGNANFCEVSVELQDKLPPTALPTVQNLDCEDPIVSDWLQIQRLNDDSYASAYAALEEAFTNSEDFGVMSGGDNCASGGALEVQVMGLDFSQFNKGCNSGTIAYTYRLQDACGNISATATNQVIIGTASDWIMRFPADQVVYCEDGNDATLAPSTIDDILTNNGCDDWGFDVKTERFEDGEDACYKLVYTYEFINWCTWNPSNTELAILERPDTFSNGVAIRYLDEDADGINDIDDGDEDNDDIYIYTNRGPFNIRDASEEENFDIYDVTTAENDGDFVIIDTGDIPYGGVTTYDLTSQFSGSIQTYVSAQEYGYFAYRQIVKVIDIGAPTVEVDTYEAFCGGDEATNGGEACTAAVDISFIVDDVCTAQSDLRVSYVLKAFEGSITTDDFGDLVSQGDGRFAIRGNYPLGTNGGAATHIFLVRVEDACGNSAEEEIRFEVKDCKAPVAVCQQALSTSMSEEGIVTLQAIDFDAGSADFCTPKSLLKYFFADPNIYPDSTTRTFRCIDGEIGTRTVDFWVQDLAGNAALCEAFVNIEPHGSNSCTGDYANVGGLITTEDNFSVADVEVRLSGSGSENKMTDAEGEYHFNTIEMGYDYSVTPRKNDKPLLGVSTYDMILISKHILNKERLNSPYKLIAADINRSGHISNADMIALRKLLLGQVANFEDNDSWRFVPADFQFQDWGDPWRDDFPETIDLNDVETDQPAADFTGIKIGDVNASAMNANAIESRSAQSVQLRTPKANLTAGEVYELPILADDLSSIEGMQMTINFDTDQLEIIDIKEGVFKYYNLGTQRLKDGQLFVSWIAVDENMSSEEAVLSLRVRAKNNVDLATDLTLSSTHSSSDLSSEAYLQSGEIASLEWTFKSAETTSYQLYQNQPNPFNEVTTINFDLPDNGDVQFDIFDVNGRLIYSNKQYYLSGAHQLQVDAAMLNGAGVYYYQIRTRDYSSGHKMILTK
ncbi:MAG: T9SS type A sorting domain-containing protein [Bacteroidota bacterium]